MSCLNHPSIITGKGVRENFADALSKLTWKSSWDTETLIEDHDYDFSL